MTASDATDRNAAPRRRDSTPELCFCGFEPDGEWTLRAVFAVVDCEGRRFRAIARVLSSGTLVDVQATDCDQAGTTGRPKVDDELQGRIQEELARARAVAVVADFDHRRGWSA